MPFELNGFNNAILDQLSQIGIEIFDNNEEESSTVPKAIYSIAINKPLGDKSNNGKSFKKGK